MGIDNMEPMYWIRIMVRLVMMVMIETVNERALMQPFYVLLIYIFSQIPIDRVRFDVE